MPTLQPKPRTLNIHPELVRLSEYTMLRRIYRALARGLCRLAVLFFIRYDIKGEENIPANGPVLIAANHLGDADPLIGLALIRRPVDLFVKVEIYDDYPILGRLIDAYGVIWIHRGLPDRRALRAALQSLAVGRAVGIAPEARESLTGALEEGTQGAAYLALKSAVSILPVTFTGTENRRILANLRRLRRTDVTITVGPTFLLESSDNLHTDLDAGTDRIMRALASQLPPEYRGVYV